MPTSGAERPITPPPLHGPVSTPWASLGRRQVVELALPGVAIGLLSGAIAGGLYAVGGLALDVALFAGVALGVPLALAGAGYEILLAQGRVPLGMLTPVALYWAVAFPVVRVIHAGLLELYAGAGVAVPHGWLDFVIYQVLLSVAFGIGYWWLHENFAPRCWFHLRDRNPVADFFITHQLQYAAAAEQERKSRRQRQEARRAQRRR
jgi:hypothetical protein